MRGNKWAAALIGIVLIGCATGDDRPDCGASPGADACVEWGTRLAGVFEALDAAGTVVAASATVEPSMTPTMEAPSPTIEPTLEATATIFQTLEATPMPAPAAGLIEGWATHYGESYQGLPLGCGGKLYDTADPQILAVSPARYSEWPCGTVLVITGAGGSLEVARNDSCPGCHANTVDLSEAGSLAVCGFVGTCRVVIEVVK
jgi:hypothetical protein